MGENRLIFGADLSAYHRDALCVGPTLSSSIAHSLISESPAHAFERHPLLGGKSSGADEDTEDIEEEDASEKAKRKTLDGGTITHALVLGRGRERLEIVPVEKLSKDGKMTTKAAKDAKEAARAAGKIAIAAPKMARYETAAAAIRAELARRGIEIDPKCAEVVLLWTEVADDPDVAGVEVQCRGLLDHLDLPGMCIDDLKTGHTAHPRRLGRKVYDYGAHVQAAAYTSGLAKVRPELAGFTRYRWLFAETRKPFPVTIAQPNGEMRELGARQWRRAVNGWARCFKTERWPAYTDAHAIVNVEPPPWALAEDLEAAIGASFSPEGLEYDE